MVVWKGEMVEGLILECILGFIVVVFLFYFWSFIMVFELIFLCFVCVSGWYDLIVIVLFVMLWMFVLLY